MNGNGFGLTLENAAALEEAGLAHLAWPTPTASLGRDAGCGAKKNCGPTGRKQDGTWATTDLSDRVKRTERAWSTPTANDAKTKAYTYDRGDKTKPRPSLLGQAREEKWPTPRASPDGGERMKRGNPTLLGAARWSTPTAQDAKNATLPRSQEARGSLAGQMTALTGGRLDPENSSTAGKSRGSLNSRWVAQLMGFPAGWCDVLESPTGKP